MSLQLQDLGDGRLHLHHGPIDLILQAWGEGAARARARAIARFDGLLEELVAELPALRRPEAPVYGPIARRMAAAVAPWRPAFITPMAAVAGAVAEAVLEAMTRDEDGLVAADIRRAYVNNGGDIALFLAPGSGEELVCAMAGGGRIRLRPGQGIGGIATSGWGGRSFSLGIADAVTVLADSAARADAAATMIANAVDLPGHPAIRRQPAHALQADSDLGARLVTTDVGPLAPQERARALQAGWQAAEEAQARGLIAGAALFLQGEVVLAGNLPIKESVNA